MLVWEPWSKPVFLKRRDTSWYRGLKCFWKFKSYLFQQSAWWVGLLNLFSRECIWTIIQAKSASILCSGGYIKQILLRHNNLKKLTGTVTSKFVFYRDLKPNRLRTTGLNQCFSTGGPRPSCGPHSSFCGPPGFFLLKMC
jgi:hypothetical protein